MCEISVAPQVSSTIDGSLDYLEDGQAELQHGGTCLGRTPPNPSPCPTDGAPPPTCADTDNIRNTDNIRDAVDRQDSGDIKDACSAAGTACGDHGTWAGGVCRYAYVK